MTTHPNSPRLVKGGIVLLDPETAQVKDVISLQYNPETMTRSFQIHETETGEGGDRSQALRLKGPPVESYKLIAELDATDLLEAADSEATALGLHRELAILESLIYPSSEAILDNEALASSGTLEILPMETPLTLFVWSKNRVLPVRVTELSITEEALGSSTNHADTDGDGLSDLEEATAGVRGGTDLNRPDTDGDGLADGSDPDPFGEGAPEAE